MRSTQITKISCLAFLLFCITQPLLAQNTDIRTSDVTSQKIITGTVIDRDNEKPLVGVTIIVVGEDKGTTTNSDGRFRLVLKDKDWQLKFSHIGYYSTELTELAYDRQPDGTIKLRPRAIASGKMIVSARALDPGQRIIYQAIKRKEDILSLFNNYSYDAHNRVVLSDPAKPDSESVMMIAESQTTSYWKKPDKYKEVITARKQTANIPAEANLLSLGEMLNFNRNRLQIGKYSVVSPTAEDALDYYNYYLMDTVYIDDRAVFHLEFEPKNVYQPLMMGNIYIADSSYEVVRVESGFSQGVTFTMLLDARYYQYLAPIKDNHWLPVEIGFKVKVRIGLPIPGIPSIIDISDQASIYNYRIEEGIPPGTFDEYALEVDEKADDLDSLAWNASQKIPPTALESYSYRRIDSLENESKPAGKYLLAGGLAATYLIGGGAYDIFHYNRVEGYYLGAGGNIDMPLKGTSLRVKTGYAFEDHHWQYKFGFNSLLIKKHRISIGAEIKDEIVHRPTIVAPSKFNPAFFAKDWGIDPFDYYREKGWSATARIKPVNHLYWGFAYNHLQQFSKTDQINHSFFGDFNTVRKNPAIQDGRLRSFESVLTYDSRRLINNKGRELPYQSENSLIVSIGGEYSSPDVFQSDFDFRRYFVRLKAAADILNLGQTRINAYLGSSERNLPPQRYFIVDYFIPGYFKKQGFNTVGDVNFGGDRVASIYLVHDFGAYMFRNSGIDLLQKIPFGLWIHGGAFWTDFRETTYPPEGENFRAAPHAYSEIGFGLSNLTPFLSPLNMAVDFTWQLSDYNTRKFYLSYDIIF